MIDLFEHVYHLYARIKRLEEQDVSNLNKRINGLEEKVAIDFARLDKAQTDVTAKLEQLVNDVARITGQLRDKVVDDPSVQKHIDGIADMLEGAVSRAAPQSTATPTTATVSGPETSVSKEPGSAPPTAPTPPVTAPAPEPAPAPAPPAPEPTPGPVPGPGPSTTKPATPDTRGVPGEPKP